MAAILPNLDRALSYITSHPWYWDAGPGLVKRPYSIDTWDFAYTAGRHDWLHHVPFSSTSRSGWNS